LVNKAPVAVVPVVFCPVGKLIEKVAFKGAPI
jgi:hypothetical protein